MPRSKRWWLWRPDLEGSLPGTHHRALIPVHLFTTINRWVKITLCSRAYHLGAYIIPMARITSSIESELG